MRYFIALLALFMIFAPAFADDGYKEIKIDPSYEHDKWVTLPQYLVFRFAAFTTSFDGPDDNDGVLYVSTGKYEEEGDEL